MIERSSPPRPSLRLILFAGGLLLTGASASAQDQGSATTRSLNTGPAGSVLTPRPNAQPPLAQPVPPRASAPEAAPRTAERTLEDLLGETEAGPTLPDAPVAKGVTLAEGESEPAPIALALGYYARGDKDCAEVWPGDGDLAFATPTAFTIDFGGCEPGPWQQTGPNSWREEQRCQTELGGDAGAYTISYEVLDAGTLKRTARLAIDGTVEEDQWKHCEPADIPENARFKS
ncbi:hypothetical protein BZG35_14305 [Brevundimonas sp. LM2]|uniref:hypothetical protein n=1 Tax=Brevundimonas sp. LM2 TaxID=1938605 RepID=UPI000983CB8F|nr:hypothetical protein [Brevundimonas sp. LM2]AQR62687.1 hypothetical protein BZG35_14305 [Brevundimonas sp. LM2]